MNIKTKLFLGVGFLFFVIFSLGGLGTYYLHTLSSKSQEIIKNNYESLLYAKNMMQALDEYEVEKATSLTNYTKNLHMQMSNITEPGERELTNDVFALSKKIPSDTIDKKIIPLIRQKLLLISEINLRAIEYKNKTAGNSASKAIFYMSIIVSVSILIAFTFMVNYPGYIANPIHELTESIKNIANKNYEQRLFFKSDDEFGELAIAFNEMAQRLDEYEHSNLALIISQKKRIETIINSMNDPVIVLDENKNILFVNEQAQKLISIDSKDLINRYSPDVAVQNDLVRTLLKREASLTPLRIYANEKESFFTKEIIPIHSQGKQAGEVIILKNITAFKELDLAKTNFIATVSHELKTPLSSIQMCSSLLEDSRIGNLNEEQKEILKTVKDETQRLMKITGELLDLSQVESGHIQLHPQAVFPHEIVDYAINAMKFQADQKQLHIEVNLEENLPSIILDLEKTAWVMVNFLSNAIRYSTEKSTILIEVTHKSNKVIFKVHDTGKGFDPQYKDKIFNKFYKIPNSPTPGTGLGLAISKDFISAQGGQIWADSEVGKGSVFGFAFMG